LAAIIRRREEAWDLWVAEETDEAEEDEDEEEDEGPSRAVDAMDDEP
jgi:hypothetical protein